MSDVIENKVVSMLDALQNGVIELGHQMVKYTPDVIQAVLGITVITGLQQLLYGVIWLVIFIIMFRYWYTHDWPGYDDDAGQAKLVLSGIVSFISFIAVLTQLADIWNYVAVFYPKLYLAHQIVDKVTAVHH